MRLSPAQLVISLCFYLSYIRGTNIGLFYPSDEYLLGYIDYSFQMIINYVLLLGVALYFFLKNDYSFFREKIRSGLWALLLGAGSISVFLSVDKMESIKFIVAVMAITLPTLIYIREFGPEKLFQSLARVFILMAFANLAYTVAFPQYAVMTGNHWGRWKGLFEHKNGAGPFFAVGFFVILHHLQKKISLDNFVKLVAAAICLLFVVMSQSSTALVAFGAIAIFYPLMYFAYRIRAGERVTFLLVVSGLALVFYMTVGPILIELFFTAIGKDASLTGRTGIWSAVLDLAHRRPLVGFGPGMSERPDFMVQIQAEVGWEAKSTHNSYLDLLIGYGYPMTILILLAILKTWLSSFTRLIDSKSVLRVYVLSSALIIATLFIAFVSASALVSRSYIWLVMVAGLSAISYMAHYNGRKNTDPA